MIEFVTASIFVLIFERASASAASAADAAMLFGFHAVLASFLIIIFVYDLKYYLILDSVIVPAIVVAFLGNLLLGVPVLRMLSAAALGAGFFAIQYVVSKGKWIGGGDIRLGALMGVMLSWPVILVALFLAYIIGSVIGVTLIAAHVKKFGSQIPFGPFLAAATFLSLLYGSDLVIWYTNLVFL